MASPWQSERGIVRYILQRGRSWFPRMLKHSQFNRLREARVGASTDRGSGLHAYTAPKRMIAISRQEGTDGGEQLLQRQRDHHRLDRRLGSTSLEAAERET